MIANLQALVKKTPEAQVNGDDFDALLGRALRSFPTSAALQDLKPIRGVTTLAVLIGRLSILHAAVEAMATAKVIDEIERQNRENERRWGRGLLDR